MNAYNKSLEIEIDNEVEYFLRWTVEKYHAEIEWDTVHNGVSETADLVRSLVES